MRRWYKKIFASLRFIMGLWLILNVSIATIPRCDQLIDLLVHALPDDSQLLTDQHDLSHCEKLGRGANQDERSAQLSTDSLCRCSLAHYIPAQLPEFATEPLGLPAAPVLFLIAFPYQLAAQDFLLQPATPPPRLFAV